MKAEKMKYRNIRQFKLSAIGYGAMGLSHGYVAQNIKNQLDF